MQHSHGMTLGDIIDMRFYVTSFIRLFLLTSISKHFDIFTAVVQDSTRQCPMARPVLDASQEGNHQDPKDRPRTGACPEFPESSPASLEAAISPSGTDSIGSSSTPIPPKGQKRPSEKLDCDQKTIWHRNPATYSTSQMAHQSDPTTAEGATENK